MELFWAKQNLGNGSRNIRGLLGWVVSKVLLTWRGFQMDMLVEK